MRSVRCRVPASWRDRSEAAGLLLDSAKSKTGTTIRTARAVDSAMRVRTAPPFVRRNNAPGSARCWAGSGHCIRAPNGQQEGFIRSGSSPQGVRPVVLQPKWCSGGLSSIPVVLSDVRRGAGPGRQTRRDHLRSQRYPIGPLFSVTAGASASRLLAEWPLRLYGEQSTGGLTEQRFMSYEESVTWTFTPNACDIDHKPPGGSAAFRSIVGIKMFSIRKNTPDQWRCRKIEVAVPPFGCHAVATRRFF